MPIMKHYIVRSSIQVHSFLAVRHMKHEKVQTCSEWTEPAFLHLLTINLIDNLALSQLRRKGQGQAHLRWVWTEHAKHCHNQPLPQIVVQISGRNPGLAATASHNHYQLPVTGLFKTQAEQSWAKHSDIATMGSVSCTISIYTSRAQ
jgi:hypothetical protein